MASQGTEPLAESLLLRFLTVHGQSSPVLYSRELFSGSRLLVGAVRQRRLGLKRLPSDMYLISSGSNVIGGFSGHVTSLISDQAERAAFSLPTVRQLAGQANLPTPESQAFSPDARDEALRWFRDLKSAAVVKPAYSVGTRGATWGVRSEEEFLQAWTSALNGRSHDERADPSLVVERQHEGINLRVYVIGERVVAATARVPFFCIGDGHSSLRELLETAMYYRQAHPLLGKHPYEAFKYARNNGLPLNQTSEVGRPYIIGNTWSPTKGGVTIDVTEALDESLADLAINAAWTLPGCRIAGVDLLVQGVDTPEKALVLNVDARANFILHYYPWIGQRRPVAKSLIHYMVVSSSV